MTKSLIQSKLYNDEYQKLVSISGQISASIIVPILIDLIHPKSVIDVGCDTGAWLKECISLGITDITGIDGSWINTKNLLIPQSKFIKADICKPFRMKRVFDMALCLEVAEHLPETSSSILINTLVKLSTVVAFSAAIPGQGGTNHINEQWLDYWEKLFYRYKYILVDAIRPVLWDQKNVEWWYAQNMVFFVKQNKLTKYKNISSLYSKLPKWQFHLVHPGLLQLLRMTIHNQQKMLERSSLQSKDNIINGLLQKIRTKI